MSEIKVSIAQLDAAIARAEAGIARRMKDAKKLPQGAARMRFVTRVMRALRAGWRESRAALLELPPGVLSDYQHDYLLGWLDRSSTQIGTLADRLASSDAIEGDEDDMIGADDEELEFQVGLYNGHAIGYCPQTGHTAAISLREVASDLAVRNQLTEVGYADRALLFDELSYQDDRPNVGKGRIAKKIKKGLKKVAKVAKSKIVKKLGKALMVTASLAAGGPAAGAAMMALKAGKKLAKKAKKKPRGKEAKAAPIASALARGKITPKQASAKAKAIKVSPKSVKSAAVALKVHAAAKKGNPKAKKMIAAANKIDRAEKNPKKLSVAPREESPQSLFAPPSPQTATSEQYELPEPAYADEGSADYQEPLEEAAPQEDLPEPYAEEPAAELYPPEDGGSEEYADEGSEEYAEDDGGEYADEGEEE